MGRGGLIEHKGSWHVEHVVLPKMEEWDREQRGNGLVSRDWAVLRWMRVRISRDGRRSGSDSKGFKIHGCRSFVGLYQTHIDE